MKQSEIQVAIKNVYGMLWELLALYEKTECYNVLPKGAKEDDIWEYMENRLMAVRKETNCLFLGEESLKKKMLQIVDETEKFVRSYELPGVVKRWKQINPQILFFDCSFDLMEECPELYQQISLGLCECRLNCYPDETLVAARKRYFANAKKKNKEDNLRYSEERVFQDELQRTLTLVFENDFREYLQINTFLQKS